MQAMPRSQNIKMVGKFYFCDMIVPWMIMLDGLAWVIKKTAHQQFFTNNSSQNAAETKEISSKQSGNELLMSEVRRGMAKMVHADRKAAVTQIPTHIIPATSIKTSQNTQHIKPLDKAYKGRRPCRIPILSAKHRNPEATMSISSLNLSTWRVDKCLSVWEILVSALRCKWQDQTLASTA